MFVTKDEGYAWIIVAASAVVMFVGPSTYSSTGLFFSKVEMTSEQRIWVCQTMYIVWSLVALLAGPLSALYTHRRVVMVGCFVAACGLSLTAITLKNPAISFLTFSILVGVGLGFASHSTFLLVCAHFHRHRGFATGIGIFSAGIGQAIVPVICRPLMEVKNIFYIRALMTAIAFMSASLYVSPTREEMLMSESGNESCETGTGTRTAVSNGPSVIKNRSGIEIIITDETILVNKPVNSNNNSKTRTTTDNNNTNRDLRAAAKTKKAERQLLAGVTANLLPHISEENELSPFLQKKEFLFPPSPEEWSSSLERKPLKKINMELAKKFAIQPIDGELEKKIAETIGGRTSVQTTQIVPLPPDRIINMRQKRLERPGSQTVHPVKHYGIEIAPLPPDLIAKIAAQGQGERGKLPGKKISPIPIRTVTSTTLSSTSRTKTIKNIEPTTGEENKSGSSTSMEYIPIWRKLFDRINFRLLINIRFLNLCVPGALSILFIQTFPIVFTSYITSVQVKAFYDEEGQNDEHETLTWDDFESKPFSCTGVGLTIIFAADMLTRLGVSYMSDLSFLNRRWCFLAGSLGTTIICLGLCVVEDILTMYVFCGAFGVCYGMMMVTESLMFVDAFGIKKLSSCYGLMNVIKVFFVLLFYPIKSPISTFMYNFHPLKSISTLNGTEFGDIDPLGLFNNIGDPEEALMTSRHWLRVLAAPGIILAFLWALELNFNRRSANQSCRFQMYRHPNPPTPVSFHPAAIRSKSNPLL